MSVPKAQGTLQKRGRNIVTPRKQELYCEFIYPRNDRDTSFMIISQHGSLNKNRTKTT